MGDRIIIPGDGFRPFRIHPEFAPRPAVGFEEEHPPVIYQPVCRYLAKIIGCNHFSAFTLLTGMVRYHGDGRIGGVDHIEHPDTDRPRFTGPFKIVLIGNPVFGSIRYGLYLIGDTNSQGGGYLTVCEEGNGSFHSQVHHCSPIVLQLHLFGEGGFFQGTIFHLPFLRIDGFGRMPVIVYLLASRFKKDGVLSAFRSQPQTVLTAITVHMRIYLSCIKEVVIHESVTVSLFTAGS